LFGIGWLEVAAATIKFPFRYSRARGNPGGRADTQVRPYIDLLVQLVDKALGDQLIDVTVIDIRLQIELAGFLDA
jgi:hypothetical protein